MAVLGGCLAVVGLATAFGTHGSDNRVIATALIGTGVVMAALGVRAVVKARGMVRDLTSTGQASTVDADTSQRSEQAKRWRYLGKANTIAAVIVSASAIRFLPWPWSLAILLVMIAAVVETWRLARKIRRA